MKEASVQKSPWRVYVELQTSSLADDVQLTAMAARLGSDPVLAGVSSSAASLGSRYSVTATVTLAAGDAKAAELLATSVLQNAAVGAGITTGRVIARGIIPSQ